MHTQLNTICRRSASGGVPRNFWGPKGSGGVFQVLGLKHNCLEPDGFLAPLPARRVEPMPRRVTDADPHETDRESIISK
jgi:hypothetical protein